MIILKLKKCIGRGVSKYPEENQKIKTGVFTERIGITQYTEYTLKQVL